MAIGYRLGKKTERAKAAKKRLAARRTLTPLLLDHKHADTLVDVGGLAAIVGDLPQWCKRPDHETTSWLNGLLAELWPQLSAALSEKIGTAVGKKLARISPMGLNLSFKEFGLGNEAISLLSVRKVGRARDTNEVILDFDMRWCGDPTVVLNASVLGLPLIVRLNELQLIGPLRLCLADFDNNLPCFHMLKIAFVERPDINFKLKLVGGDIDMVMGLKEKITEAIGNGLGKALVWPKYIRVPIANKNRPGAQDVKVGVDKADAAGVLEVTLVSGSNLRNMRSIGKSDPYVTFSLTNSGRKETKSSVIKRDLNPRWNEHFKIVLDDLESHELQFVVADYSAMAEDAGVKKIEKCFTKMDVACCGWWRRRTGAKGARDAKSRAMEVEGAMFQTVMGTGSVKVSELKPFQEVTKTVPLSKDAISVFSDPTRRKTVNAGSVTLRMRIIPLTSTATRTAKNLESAGLKVKKQMLNKRAEHGIKDPKKTFMERFGRPPSDEELEEEKKRSEEKPVDFDKSAKEAVELMLNTVLGGNLDLSDARQAEQVELLKPHLNGLLYVTLVKGEGLVVRDVGGTSDPYFKIKLKSQSWRSPVIYKTLNPVYDAGTEFIVSPSDLLSPGVTVKCECWDKDIVGKEFMGECDIDLKDVVKRSLEAVGGWVYRRVELRGVEHGSVHVKFRFQPADVGMRETTTEAKQGYLARRKSRVRRKAERRSLDREGKDKGSLDKKDSLDDEDDGNEDGVLLVHEEDYFDFGSDGEPSSGDDSDVELHPQGSASPTRLKVIEEGQRSPPRSPPRRGLFGRKK